MKKGLVLVVVLVVLPVAAWLAATFYVGLRVEQVVRDEVAKMEICLLYTSDAADE